MIVTISKVTNDGTVEELYNSDEMKYDFLPEETGFLDVSGADYLRISYKTRKIGIGSAIIIGDPVLIPE